MKKIFTSLVYLFIMGASLQAQQTLTLDDVEFDISTGTITDYKAGYTDIVIPASFNVNGSDVTITNIDNQAFYNNKLTSVSIPNTVTTIGNSAFEFNQLNFIILPNSVKAIYNYAFRYNELTRVEVPNGLVYIGNEAFSNNKIKSIIIPNSVTNINNGAFNVNQIESINGESSNGIFYARKEDGTEDKTTIASYGGISKVIDFISKDVTTIGDFSFKDCQIYSIDIPNNITTIGNYAFYNNKLTSVIIPKSVTLIGYRAFNKNILTTISIPNSITSIREYTFCLNQISSVEIPNSVVEIDQYAFYGNQITSITISNSVKVIGKQAFNNNIISEVTLPKLQEGYNVVWKDNNTNIVEKITNFETGYTKTATPIQYTITYNENGGTHNNPTEYTIESETIALESATKGSSKFIGWYTNKDFSGEAVIEIPQGSIGNKELWAKFEVSTAVDDVQESLVKLYPNPAQTYFIVETKDGQGRVSLYNIAGSMELTQELIQTQERIDISNLSKGIYLVKVETSSGLVCKRVVVK